MSVTGKGSARQIELRDDLGVRLLKEIEAGRITLAQALAVCIGTCAALLSVIPDAHERSETAKILTDDLAGRAAIRRTEIFGAPQ